MNDICLNKTKKIMPELKPNQNVNIYKDFTICKHLLYEAKTVVFICNLDENLELWKVKPNIDGSIIVTRAINLKNY